MSPLSRCKSCRVGTKQDSGAIRICSVPREGRTQIIKIGSGNFQKKDVYRVVAETVKELRDRRVNVILVASGAIATGLRLARSKNRPEVNEDPAKYQKYIARFDHAKKVGTEDLSSEEKRKLLKAKRGLSALGQREINAQFNEALQAEGLKGIKFTTVKLSDNPDAESGHDFQRIGRKFPDQNKQGYVPLVNGDAEDSNDRIAAHLGHVTNADVVVAVSPDVEGLYHNPKKPRTQIKRVIGSNVPHFYRGPQLGMVGGIDERIEAFALYSNERGHVMCDLDGLRHAVIKATHNRKAGSIFCPKE